MSSWRDQILKEFVPGVARLTLVADPDGLLLEEGVLEVLQERGFEIVPFQDHVSFRYLYESRFRSRSDCGREANGAAEKPATQSGLVVVLESEASDLDTLPYDLLQVGRKLSFSLSDLFPGLSYPVIAALDRADLDALLDAQARHMPGQAPMPGQPHAPGQLGDNATKDFVLRHVFEIALELIKEPKDLLRALLRRHYRGQRIPPLLDERFIQVLRQNRLFEDWPLETIVPGREAFFAFLQERWPLYLDSLVVCGTGEVGAAGVRVGTVVGTGAVGADNMPAGSGLSVAERTLQFPGPELLPFGHDDVRVYIDNLFLEGLLQPVSHEHAEIIASTWAACGLSVSPTYDRQRRLEGLLSAVEEMLPGKEARSGEWLRFAYQWTELAALGLELGTAISQEHEEHLQALRARVDQAFREWMIRRFGSLINLPPVPPVMLHHLPRYLARSLADNRQARVAYLVVDGLALDQWIVLREVLREQDSKIEFREDAVFAWVPTLTSVSRQAAFAGVPPIYFQSTINTADKESHLWAQFWMKEGLTRDQVAYMKGLGDLASSADCAGGPGTELPEGLCEVLSQPKLRVVGLVIDKVDRIMHGMELGAAGMLSQVRQWAKQGFMQKLISFLHEHGFQIYLTSDHGNIEAKGIGKPAEGAVAELRGERARVYRDPRLRARAKERFREAWEWPPIGLPEGYLALLAPNRSAFVQEGKRVVSHGGVSVEEVIVPFVEIRRQ